MLKKLKGVTFAFILGLILSFSTTAMADQALSDVTYLGTVNGYTYTASGLIDNGNGARGYSALTATDATVPIGYMGISSYVYNSAGVCVTYSPWSYNTSPTQGIGSFTSWYTVSGTYYRSSGSAKMYNGSNYTERSTNYTPYLYY